MPRWEHGSEDRLKQAAMELFDEQGFANTTAVEIANRARVTTRTFFRYFSDKQALVFADAESLRAALVERILQATTVAEPLQTVMGALAGFDWESLGSRDVQRQRGAMIDANPDLLERELIKQQQMADEFRRALEQRGVAAHVAELAADVGIQLFRIAYRRWLAADHGEAGLHRFVDEVTSTLAGLVAGNPSAAAT
ncbi:TetR family transcriptional regulator [Mycolicibacterium arabiense]|jgi:AcrR family transcriptional regulator|uniref:TetR family transcriptional regulator n=1 Tax=Mycolicibacterium arabiense TaxID=1286181 RepID=A0A7I7RRW9_9MYCO|nr:TetR family transcriptional regulator [Mycolicibacterium arabiense]MCV7376029.1 TetR family transcriptional regulator [Mycolicibacterium arabiense]BBY47304.1 TetR family transcriptional regulator [Mycolicibacterium arabiense]